MIGRVTGNGRLCSSSAGHQVADIDMKFLHHGWRGTYQEGALAAPGDRRPFGADRAGPDRRDTAAPAGAEYRQQGVGHPAVRPRGAGHFRAEAVLRTCQLPARATPAW